MYIETCRYHRVSTAVDRVTKYHKLREPCKVHDIKESSTYGWGRKGAWGEKCERGRTSDDSLRNCKFHELNTLPTYQWGNESSTRHELNESSTSKKKVRFNVPSQIPRNNEQSKDHELNEWSKHHKFNEWWEYHYFEKDDSPCSTVYSKYHQLKEQSKYHEIKEQSKYHHWVA